MSHPQFIWKYLIMGKAKQDEFLAKRFCSAASEGDIEVLHLIHEKYGEEVLSYRVPFKQTHLRRYGESTALEHGAFSGNLDVVQYLFEQDNNTLEDHEKFMAALHLSALGGHVDVVDYLLKNVRNLNINAQDRKGNTALHLGCNHIAVVKTLIQEGADPYVRNNKGDSVLHASAKEGCFETMKFLIEEINLDPDDKNDKQENTLHCFLQKNWNDVSGIQFLIDTDTDINSRDDNGFTVLHKAVFKNNYSVVKCLVKNGADVEAETNDGTSVINLTNDVEIRRLLRKYEQDLSSHFTTTSIDSAETSASSKVFREELDFILKGKPSEKRGRATRTATSAPTSKKDYADDFANDLHSILGSINDNESDYKERNETMPQQADSKEEDPDSDNFDDIMLDLLGGI